MLVHTLSCALHVLSSGVLRWACVPRGSLSTFPILGWSKEGCFPSQQILPPQKLHEFLFSTAKID